MHVYQLTVLKRCCYDDNNMNEAIYDDIRLENIARDKFGVKFSIDRVILRDAPVDRSTKVTVLLTEKNQLFAYVQAQASLTLGGVRKHLLKMGLKPKFYIPPGGQPGYFDEVGKQNFQAVFPGRKTISPEDLIYYRTLAAYNPALVQISEVIDGEIRQFDADTHGNWRVAAKFSYRNVQTK